MPPKHQSNRLTAQHLLSKGVSGIFGRHAKSHDLGVSDASKLVIAGLGGEYPSLQFRYRTSIRKSEINASLRQVDPSLGQVLFVEKSSIIPDGGLVEVQDDRGNWRVILVSEAKHQGRDIRNVENGVLVGPNKNRDLMDAGNAIERSHKNIAEIANLMLHESHFPYVLFLEGSNFLTETLTVTRPDGREVILQYNSGKLNRIDRLTSANYGMSINQNLCENKFVTHNDKTIMLQAASLYTQGNGQVWDAEEMLTVMLSIAKTSLRVLARDIFDQITSES